jgi:hypothetical protein
MAKQTFTASQVLTAAQMNTLQTNDYNQTVSTKTASYTLVAADVGTKIVMNAGATDTTITVNTSLFAAGDTLEILNTSTSGICTITAGTATVSTSSTLRLGLNAGGRLYFTSTGVSIFQNYNAGGLVLVASASATSGSSLAVNNCFSSAYNNYRVIIDNTLINSTVQMTMTFGATTTNYYWANLTVSYDNGAVAGSNGANTASIQLGTVPDIVAGNGAAIDILNPNLVARTGILATGTDQRPTQIARWGQAFIANLTQYTGFTISVGAAVFTSCNVRVYGYTL